VCWALSSITRLVAAADGSVFVVEDGTEDASRVGSEKDSSLEWFLRIVKSIMRITRADPCFFLFLVVFSIIFISRVVVASMDRVFCCCCCCWRDRRHVASPCARYPDMFVYTRMSYERVP
jgi:hypothetical protein